MAAEIGLRTGVRILTHQAPSIIPKPAEIGRHIAEFVQEKIVQLTLEKRVDDIASNAFNFLVNYFADYNLAAYGRSLFFGLKKISLLCFNYPKITLVCFASVYIIYHRWKSDKPMHTASLTESFSKVNTTLDKAKERVGEVDEAADSTLSKELLIEQNQKQLDTQSQQFSEHDAMVSEEVTTLKKILKKEQEARLKEKVEYTENAIKLIAMIEEQKKQIAENKKENDKKDEIIKKLQNEDSESYWIVRLCRKYFFPKK